MNEISDGAGATGGSVAEEVADGHGALHAGFDAGVVGQQAVDEIVEVAHGVVLRGRVGLRRGSAENRGDDADQAEECGKAVGDDGGHEVSPCVDVSWFRVSAAAVLRQSVSEVSSSTLPGETVISTSRAVFPGNDSL